MYQKAAIPYEWLFTSAGYIVNVYFIHHEGRKRYKNKN